MHAIPEIGCNSWVFCVIKQCVFYKFNSCKISVVALEIGL